MATIHIRELYSGAILHSIQVEGRSADPFPLDLHDLDLSNLCLNGADLQWANLQGTSLRGTKLKEACLFRANLKDALVDYADLNKADLREANLEGTILWPSETLGTKFTGAKITPGSEVEHLARITVEEKRRRRGR